jgi:hypothetical protein
MGMREWMLSGDIGMASPKGFARYITLIQLPCEVWLQAA